MLRLLFDLGMMCTLHLFVTPRRRPYLVKVCYVNVSVCDIYCALCFVSWIGQHVCGWDSWALVIVVCGMRVPRGCV